MHYANALALSLLAAQKPAASWLLVLLAAALVVLARIILYSAHEKLPKGCDVQDFFCLIVAWIFRLHTGLIRSLNDSYQTVITCVRELGERFYSLHGPPPYVQLVHDLFRISEPLAKPHQHSKNRCQSQRNS